MKFNTLTHNISFGILAIAALYTFIYSGISGLLICSAVTFLIASFVDQFEIVTACAVLFSLFYISFLKKFLKKLEPFESKIVNNGIINNVRKMNEQYKPEITGVYSSSIEGFEVQPDVPTEGESDKSSPAPTNIPNQINTEDIKKVASAVTSAMKNTAMDTTNKTEEPEKPTPQSNDIAKEEFQSATNELFKLGKMPSEHTDGPMLDAGSTLLKAMGSFKPEQINAMSDDTKKLLETQKSLMGMLTQMRPVLADGKELLQTFSGMFGNGGLGGLKL